MSNSRSTKNTRKGKNTDSKEKKTFKNQNFKMRGKLTKCDFFGKDNSHSWFVLEEETNGTKYLFTMFNISDEHSDVLSDSEMVEVYFNIGYNKKGNDISLRLICYDIYCAD